MLSLGEFNTDNYDEDAKDSLVWIVFILPTFITQITFLNMLIAIMGDTFARVSEVKEQSALQEKIKILSDYVIIAEGESENNGLLNRFLFSIKPKSLASDESGNWEGTVTQLKKAIDKSMQIIKRDVDKSHSAISTEVNSVSNRLSSLDDKINDL